jgi:hypothetical protein
MNVQSSRLLPTFMLAWMLSGSTAVAQQDVPQPSGAQYGSTPLQPGDRVRVQTMSSQAAYVGTVVAADENTITIDGDEKGKPIVLRQADVTRLDVSVGTRSRGTHVLAGIAIGGGLGALIGLASGDDPDSQFIAYSAGEKAVMLAIPLALAGTLIGLVLPAGEKWEEVPMNHGEVSIDPATGTVGYSLVYRF